MCECDLLLMYQRCVIQIYSICCDLVKLYL
jgi:hypothetical protein